MALPKKNRIVKEKDFETVFNKGKTVNGSFLFIRAKTNDINITRFGFVIAKKVIPEASARNRLKRVLSEKAQKIIKVKIKKGVDIVVVVRKSDKEQLLINELEKLLGAYI